MIVVFGSINIDLVFAVADLPGTGETVLSEGYDTVPGGKGANQAVAAARARGGAPGVHMIGCIGADGFGDIAHAAIAASGCDVSLIARTARPTGCAAIAVDRHGANMITVASGANLDAAADMVPDALLGPDTVVLLQNEVRPAENLALARRAAAREARVILNAAPARPLAAQDWAGLLDALVVNETELVAVAGAAGRPEDFAALAAGLAARLGTTVIATLGADGALACRRDGGGYRIGAMPIEPVDTTAAGDCFVGVLADGTERGLDLADALRRASVAAGLACTRRGAQPSLPSDEEIAAHLDRLPAARLL